LKHSALLLSLALLAAPALLVAQTASSPSSLVGAEGGGGQVPSTVHYAGPSPGPFSRLAFGGGISTMGINLQAATNLDRYINLRVIGNVFQYTTNNISTNGFNVGAKLNFASAGAALDLYPLQKVAFRLSPGVLFLNNNSGSGTFTAQGGTSFTLDNVTYYASSTNPVQGVGNLGLNAQKPAFTVTGGWGNMIPRKAGGHLSFPVEVGVAFIGAPTLNIVLNSGQVCNAQGQNCVDVATDADVQTNLKAQIAKYQSDLNPLKTYPIVSFGVAYSFHVR
jgi:hypothetical protein